MFKLAEKAQKSGYGLVYRDQTQSTMDEVWELFHQGQRLPFWLVSVEQKSGRGRRGRNWQCARGNLASTLLLHVHRSLSEIVGLSFVASLALRHAILDVQKACGVQPVDVHLKWPNDLLLNHKKCAGILVETRQGVDGKIWVAIGLGVNICAFPDQDIAYSVTSLQSELKTLVKAEDVFVYLSQRWVEYYQIFLEKRGEENIIAQWIAAAHQIGHVIKVESTQQVFYGKFLGIDSSFHLLLEQNDGTVLSIATGDVLALRNV